MSQTEKVAEVRALLSDKAREICDDAMVRRYIRATAGDLAKAAKRIEDSVKWRLDVQPDSLVCKTCAGQPGLHYMNVVGYCNLDRPVFYSCMKLSRSKDVIGGKHHLINRFEQAIRMMPEGIEQWVWVSDFYGFGMGDMHPAMAKQFVELSAIHYPERLGAYFVVDAPYIFEGLWKLVKGWLDPVTVRKIFFLPYDVRKGKAESKLIQTLSQQFPQDLADWFIEEMAENRVRETAAAKTSYEMRDVYRQALKGELCPSSGHDVRGCKVVLDKYVENPGLLLPQGNK